MLDCGSHRLHMYSNALREKPWIMMLQGEYIYTAHKLLASLVGLLLPLECLYYLSQACCHCSQELYDGSGN